MAVQDPGTLMVECDECGQECEMATTQYVDQTFGVSSETMEEHEWSEDGSCTFCPQCTKEKE